MGENPPDTLSPNKAVSVMGYAQLPQPDVMRINMSPMLIGKKRKGKFTGNTVQYGKLTVTVEDLNECYGTQTF